MTEAEWLACADTGQPAAAVRAERERLVLAVPAGWPHMFCRFLMGVADPGWWGRQVAEDHAATLAGYARSHLGGSPEDTQCQWLRDIFSNPFAPSPSPRRGAPTPRLQVGKRRLDSGQTRDEHLHARAAASVERR